MSKQIRITQIDGALPNLALMRLASWHTSQGDTVHFTRTIEPTLFEPRQYDRVYGSCIFDFSRGKLVRFQQAWPGAIVGGTGSGDFTRNVEDFIGDHAGVDYSGYPDFNASIGFTQRGCRLSCKFCVVPRKEGRNRSVNTVADIWRGAPWPRLLHLLDNDFFGNPEWRDRVREIRDGKFRICLSQGINVRLINQEAAEALAAIEYRDTKFSQRKLYTAWDNLGDERRFFDGVAVLERAGIPPKHLMTFMLVGYDIAETWERIWYRFKRMVDQGIQPYPMVYDRSRKDLLCFQRWVITGLYRVVQWSDYQRETKSTASMEGWRRVYAA